jgi:ribose/xylose/arabinose/galactoside ABC-type transport system permease subunit
MIIEGFQLFSSLALGLLVGSLLTEAMILVPYWRSMEAKEFLRLHHTLGPRLFMYFAPLTIVATILPVLAALMPVILGETYHWLSLVPAIITLVMLTIYMGYFKGANESFKSATVGVEGLAEELTKWARWHWLRVFLGMAAFFISLLVVLYSA